MSIGHVCHQSLIGLSCTSVRPKAISRLEASQEKGRLVRRVGHLGRCFVIYMHVYAMIGVDTYWYFPHQSSPLTPYLCGEHLLGFLRHIFELMASTQALMAAIAIVAAIAFMRHGHPLGRPWTGWSGAKFQCSIQVEPMRRS